MHVLQSTFQNWKEELSSIPESVLNRCQSFFYVAFPLLSITCVVLTVTSRRNDAGLIIIALLSALYECVMCCFCMDKEIKVGYALWMHSGVVSIFIGMIALEYALIPAAVILLCVGLLFVAVVAICYCLGHDVLVERRGNHLAAGPLQERQWV